MILTTLHFSAEISIFEDCFDFRIIVKGQYVFKFSYDLYDLRTKRKIYL